MNLTRTSKQRSALTWLTVVVATLLTIFFTQEVTNFLAHPFETSNEMHRYIKQTDSFLLILIPIFFQGKEFPALGFALGVIGAIASIAAVLAAVIMWRAPDKAANRQIAGLLIGFALFCALAYFVRSLPAYHQVFSMGMGESITGTCSTILLVYLFLALPRFLVIFPRAVDSESVYQAYLRRPIFMRWSRKSPSQKSLLPFWHQHLVSGKILWLAVVAPIALSVIVKGIDQLTPFDTWGGIAFAGVIGILAMYVVWGLPYAFASISHIYRYGTLEERQRIAWLRAVLFGLGVVFLVCLLALLLAACALWFQPETATALGQPIVITMVVKLIISIFVFLLFMPAFAIIAVGLSVLHGGQLDPRLAFTRITLWSVMGVAVTLAFVAIERYVAIKVVHWFSLPADTGGIAAGVMVVGTFMPARNFASRQINRLANRWIPLRLLSEGERVVKAVAISDLSGYTALSAANESNAILQSAALSRQAQKIAESNGGKLVKSLGDAVMLTFENAIGALNMIRELHVEFPKVVGILGIEPLPLHSAIHMGEIVESNDGDIFGQTVNVTARLVDAASAGEIVLSDQVRDNLHPDIQLQSLGQRRFKNVPQPVECFRLI